MSTDNTPTPAQALGEVLLPCPFCGGEPHENAIEPHTHSPFLKNMGIPDHGGSHVIECGCGAGLIDDTREAVVIRWNQRQHGQHFAGLETRLAEAEEMLGWFANNPYAYRIMADKCSEAAAFLAERG